MSPPMGEEPSHNGLHAAAAAAADVEGAAAEVPSCCAAMLPPGLDDPKVWRLRFIVQSTLAPGRTMADHAAHLPEHHAYLADLQKQGLLAFMGPFLTADAHDCGDGMFCLAVGSHAEAAAIAARNPFHRRGIRVYTVRPWLEKILS